MTNANPFDRTQYNQGPQREGTRKGQEAPRTHEPQSLEESLAVAYTERLGAGTAVDRSDDPLRGAVAEHLRQSAETIARLSPQPSKASSTRPFDGA